MFGCILSVIVSVNCSFIAIQKHYQYVFILTIIIYLSDEMFLL